MATRPIPLAEVERREVDQTVAGRDVGRYRTQAVLAAKELDLPEVNVIDGR